jgi:hypothetical protein
MRKARRDAACTWATFEGDKFSKIGLKEVDARQAQQSNARKKRMRCCVWCWVLGA